MKPCKQIRKCDEHLTRLLKMNFGLTVQNINGEDKTAPKIVNVSVKSRDVFCIDIS